MSIWLVAGYATLALYMLKLSLEDEDDCRKEEIEDYREEDDYE
jgi:hypothetical protein